MSKKPGRSSVKRREQGWAAKLPLIGLVVLGGVLLIGAALLWPRGTAEPTAWARLGTQDVHSLSFVEDTERLLFGHHDGLLESSDGGRTWQPLAAGADAMSLSVDGPSIVIAGHHVLQESTDGGHSWSDIPTDLPNTDIHAFARSLADPGRMWAYLAEGGIYQSTDGGRRWQKVYDEHVVQLTAALADGRDRLLGVHPSAGLVMSEDGGRSWSFLSEPPAAPVTSLTASPSGEVVLLGGPRGLFRSSDAGRSWQQILDAPTVLAAAVSQDGGTVAAVTSDTRFYRSDDGGRSWPGP